MVALLKERLQPLAILLHSTQRSIITTVASATTTIRVTVTMVVIAIPVITPIFANFIAVIFVIVIIDGGHLLLSTSPLLGLS